MEIMKKITHSLLSKSVLNNLFFFVDYLCETYSKASIHMWQLHLTQ